MCLDKYLDWDILCHFFSTKLDLWCTLYRLRIWRCHPHSDRFHNLTYRHSYPTHHPLLPSLDFYIENTHIQVLRYLSSGRKLPLLDTACCHIHCRISFLWNGKLLVFEINQNWIESCFLDYLTEIGNTFNF